jgi:hypothetical protein
MKRCVEKIKGQGKSESSAWAICSLAVSKGVDVDDDATLWKEVEDMGGKLENVAFVPITKIDVEKREVWGILAEERPDKADEIMDYAKSKPHFEAWSGQFEKATADTGQEPSLGNLRAMHGDVAAGKFISVGFDDENKRIPVGAKVVDDNEWEKCISGVYTGFSVGGKYGERWPDGKLTRYVALPSEGSLCDNPCMYGAEFTVVKADGAEEMRKFVGGELKKDELDKDAVAAVQAANDAIAKLKSLVSELALMDGEPDTWALDSVVEAIRGAVSGKIAAENAGGDTAAGAGPEQPLAMTLAANLRKQGIKPGTLVVTYTDDDGVHANTEDEFLGKAAEGLATAELLEVTADENLTKMLGTIEESNKAISESASAIAKAVKDGEAVNAAVKPVLEKLVELEKQLAKIGAMPGPRGRPVQKGVGAGIIGDTPQDDLESMEKAINLAKDAGATPEVLREMRLKAAAAISPR